MTKLVLEVIGASDLMPKDGQGSANPFVEARFGDQVARTQIKTKDLNPHWNQKLVFHIDSASDLSSSTIEAVVYNHRDDQQKRNFLGQVRITGECIVPLDSKPEIQSYPLQKRSPFSHIKGDIALKIYVVQDLDRGSDDSPPEIATRLENPDPPPPPPVKEEKHQNVNGPGTEKKKKSKEKEVRTFHSIAASSGARQIPPVQHSPVIEMRSDFARMGPAATTVMHMQPPPRTNPEFQLVETKPPVAARMGYRRGEKMAGTYDLVEQRNFLYVKVVKAKDLPMMDLTGSLDPYVEVRLGNYKGVTRYLEKNQRPTWNQVFAFPKQQLQWNIVEVVVKDKDLISKDDFVGRVGFDLSEVPVRVPPDSPLAPQWYVLEDKQGFRYKRGEIMLAVWMGTQADESFPDAWHADAHSLRPESLSHTRAKVYFSPKLYYLRVGDIQVQDVVISDRSQAPHVSVRVQVGNQRRETCISERVHTSSHAWKEEFMFVVSEPLDEALIVKVVHKVSGQGKDEELLGMFVEPVRNIPLHTEHVKPPESRWFNLRPYDENEWKKKESKFSSKIHMNLCLEVGYHVLDESTHFSSDLQPSYKPLRKSSIGFLELGILGAQNLVPMKGGIDGRTTDAYCIAKYGNKWIRTRTHLDTLNPDWNEQYTWDVYDPCTVITIGVFDNSQIMNANTNNDTYIRDQRIGKVRIRLSTLQTDRIYTHYYPLLALHESSGLKKHGELQLAVRFTCNTWVNMVAHYAMPLLPKMHYINPISVRQIDWLRHQAMLIVAARLTRAEPPLRNEVVEYMLDVDLHMWSLRKSKANFYRIMSVLSGLTKVCRWFEGICLWKNPVTTCLVHILFLILVCYPELILPTFFLYLFVIGLWNYRFRPRGPPHMDAKLSQAEMVHLDELDEEFDSFPTRKNTDIVRMRYDRLRSLAGRVQTVVGDLATQGERGLALLSWRDPRATAIFIIFSLILAVAVYVTPFQVVAVLMGLYLLRHPQFRVKMPSVPVNFFKRLPAKSDMLL